MQVKKRDDLEQRKAHGDNATITEMVKEIWTGAE